MKNEGLLFNLGKSKAFYYTSNPEQLIMRYLDNISSLTMNKNETIAGTGQLRSLVCAKLFLLLQEKGFDTHFIKLIKPGEMLVEKLDMIKIEVIPRNLAAGSICRKYPIPRGHAFNPPILKLDLKYADDPMLNTDYAVALGIATVEELKCIRNLAFEVNEVIKNYLYAKDLILVDFKFEVGRTSDGKIVIGDEISTDGMRIWDKDTNQSVDKDVYRFSAGNIVDIYKLIAKRLEIDIA